MNMKPTEADIALVQDYLDNQVAESEAAGYNMDVADQISAILEWVLTGRIRKNLGSMIANAKKDN